MTFKTQSFGGTVEILVGLTDMHTLTPITVAAPSGGTTTVVKAGTPLKDDGTATTGANAFGILLYDVDTGRNPNGTVVQSGPINSELAQSHSGVTYASALYTALPAVQFRTGIGVNP